MTKRERAQVVELLRCAADLGLRNEGLLLTAANQLGYVSVSEPFGPEVFHMAHDAWSAVIAFGVFSNETGLLEAAQRVEDKEWP